MGASIPSPTAVAAAGAVDEQLVARLERGDRDAFDELYRRHAHPAWRVALAVGGSAAVAEQAVSEGFTAALRRHGSGAAYGVPFRLLVVRATAEAAGAEATSGVAPAPDAAATAAVGALQRLPARSRAVLWLTAAEGGSAAQVAPIVGLEPHEAAAVAARAEAAVRAQAELGPDESLRAALVPLVIPLPIGLAASAAAWWTAWHAEAQAAQRRRIGAVATVGPLTERVVGTAAAVVLAAGVAAALLSDRDHSQKAPTVAQPAGGEQAVAAPAAAASAPTGIPPVAPPAPAAPPAAPALAASVLAAREASSPSGTTSSPRVAAPTTAAPPSAPIAPQSPEDASAPLAAVGASIAGTPISVSVGTDGVGLQVGSTTVGTPPPAPSEPGIVIVTGVLPPITVPLP